MNTNHSQIHGLSRREFLVSGALGAAGLALSGPLALAAEQTRKPTAKTVIQIWLAGGPSHLDTFDPKPNAGEAYCGPFRKPAITNVPGIAICELLPLLAQQADKYSLIRSMTHGNNGHETAAYITLTGTMPSADLAYPAVGSVVALMKGYDAGYTGSLPPYVVLTQPFGRFSEAGFLGPRYKSFATGGDPSQKEFRVGGIVLPGGMTPERVHERRELLKAVDTAGDRRDPQVEKMVKFDEAAYGLITGNARQVFDLSQEKDELRDKYGRNHFGQSCLLARRLAEKGVPFVTIHHPGWDTHKENFEAMQKKLPVLDQGMAALLEDLSQRGLLESTIVTCFGEFGRTPKIDVDPPWFNGRGHHGKCFSALVAGGGFKGGHIVGASDQRGEEVKERPVYPWDLSASIYRLMGIDPHGRLPHPQGCVAYVSPLAAGGVQSGGLLTEIM